MQFGRGGNDGFFDTSSNNTVFGGSGKDGIQAGAGASVQHGGANDDDLTGGGQDVQFGGAGSDIVWSGIGDFNPGENELMIEAAHTNHDPATSADEAYLYFLQRATDQADGVHFADHVNSVAMVLKGVLLADLTAAQFLAPGGALDYYDGCYFDS